MSQPSPLVTITIDGQAIQVPAGTNLIEAAALVNTEIPHFCYHPKLSVPGNCRMCLVEIGTLPKERPQGLLVADELGQPEIAWSAKPVIACATPATEGLHVRTRSPFIKKCQEGVMELLLINHPLDCPICDRAGECRLQEFATDYGRGYSRFVETKNVKPKRTLLGPRVMLDDERCILCSRCVRFCREVVKEDVLGFTERGSYSTLTCYPGKELNNNYSLNTVDICPVGALTSTDFRFKMRVWFLKPTPSICTESSVGVNTEVWSREGKIYRITPRRNDSVNDTWMSDSGRLLYKQVEAPSRLTHYTVESAPASALEAIQKASMYLQSGKVGYVVSGHCSMEEQYMLSKLVTAAPGPVYGVSHLQAGDGLLISNDATPNLRGALVVGLLETIPDTTLQALCKNIEAGAIDTLLVYHEDVVSLIPPELLNRLTFLYIGIHRNATTLAAQVVLPALTVFEKSGTFVNQQFRLQKFQQAIPGPAGLLPDTALISQLEVALTGLESDSDAGYASAQDVWQALPTHCEALAGLTFDTLPETGVLLDATPWEHLKFCEDDSLHYKRRI